MLDSCRFAGHHLLRLSFPLFIFCSHEIHSFHCISFSFSMYRSLLRVFCKVNLVDMIYVPGILISPFILVDIFSRYLFTFESWNLSYNSFQAFMAVDNRCSLILMLLPFFPFSFSIVCLLCIFGILILICQGDTLLWSSLFRLLNASCVLEVYFFP